MKVNNIYLKSSEWNIEKFINESPIFLEADDSYDIYIFRKMLEAAMTLGFWNGSVPLA
jgi:hypothetical protein